MSEAFNYCGIGELNSQGSPIIVYNKKGIYYLYAVVMHAGKDSESGHYYVIIRENPGDEWHKFNDMRVTNL